MCSTRNVELVESVGADRVIDYTRQDYTRGKLRYDVILDNVLNRPPTATTRVLAPNGTFIPNSAGTRGGMLGGLPRVVRAFILGLGSTNVQRIVCEVNRENLAALATLLESGDVKSIIERTYPLDDAAAAVAHMLTHRARGKIAIAV